MSEWLKLAFRKDVVGRGLKVGAIVGTILTAINQGDLILGGSPRASITLLLTSKTAAALRGRDYVTPDDVKFMATPTYRHRIILRPEAEIEGLDADAAIRRFITTVDVPR